MQADILRLPIPDGAVDGITCGFALRNLVELPPFFQELARVVRPGGRIALLDVGVPRNPLVRFGHGIYFGKIVPKVGAWLSDPAAYRYLPEERRVPPAHGPDGRHRCVGPASAMPATAGSRSGHPTAHGHPEPRRRIVGQMRVSR